jgi:osomolarity two-component system, sensor histidine kinase NIK1
MSSDLTDRVRSISEVTKAIALSDLSKIVNVDVQPEGEMLDLKMTANSMVAQMSNLAHEVTRVSLEVGTEYWVGRRSEVQGKECRRCVLRIYSLCTSLTSPIHQVLTDNVNLMAMNLTNQVRSIAEVTKAVAGGDLRKKIEVDGVWRNPGVEGDCQRDDGEFECFC